MVIYNTLTRKKEEFVPIDENEIKIYVCGPTVYNYFHVGNARPFVVFDTLRKYLEYKGKNVKYVQNFTDVDDKIINRASEEGVAASAISEQYIQEYYKDAEALHIGRATAHPKVTENMDEIIQFVQALIDKGYAYEADGDVYYSTRKFREYGKLSRQNIEELEAGARVEVSERKADPLDFALWKKRKSDSEAAWDSPWGMGRPGWHIECSAMSKKFLGDTIDIHAGGQDLTFPHHENEIAQSEAASGKPFANYWMHNGYITIDNEKMSKSKGNFFTVREILKEYDGETLRFFLLSGHYRSPINFSRDMMEQARSGLARMRNAKMTLLHMAAAQQAPSGYVPGNADELDPHTGMTQDEALMLEGLKTFQQRFVMAMDDDLNTADAISVIFELINVINITVKDGASAGFAKGCFLLLDELTDVLGLLRGGGMGDDEGAGEIDALVQERNEARAAKDFARADEIRDILKGKGYTLKDTPYGVQVIRE
ncbi:MAG: cysteine--tRNA ligase [Clostridiales Family XIII bacterium]|jgi:cysteinyl-tRNA synthetase|nr:cysteine--tRNA ligase [Clostridiales Family XIII bacterium]